MSRDYSSAHTSPCPGDQRDRPLDQARILQLLQRWSWHNDGLELSEGERHALWLGGLERRSLDRLVNLLAERALIELRPDGRSVRVSVTDAGRALAGGTE